MTQSRVARSAVKLWLRAVVSSTTGSGSSRPYTLERGNDLFAIECTALEWNVPLARQARWLSSHCRALPRLSKIFEFQAETRGASESASVEIWLFRE
jgi:hypothetical protein